MTCHCFKTYLFSIMLDLQNCHKKGFEIVTLLICINIFDYTLLVLFFFFFLCSIGKFSDQPEKQRKM